MKIGYVIGKVTLSKRDKALDGAHLIIVSPLDKEHLRTKKFSISKKQYNCVVYDSLGAKEGDTIGYVEGAEATATFDSPIPIDSYNVAIFENINYKE